MKNGSWKMDHGKWIMDNLQGITVKWKSDNIKKWKYNIEKIERQKKFKWKIYIFGATNFFRADIFVWTRRVALFVLNAWFFGIQK